jgi:hypothetical protein
LGNDQKNIVHLIIEILRADLPPQEEADASRENAVQFFQAGCIAGAYEVN